MALTPDAVRRGVVVLVRLPRDKARPAVVVRSDLLSELSYATVLPITTDLRAGFSMRIDLAPTPENGLRAASQVMVDWPQTVRLDDMGQAIGRLDMAAMQAITRQVAVALGIGSGGRSRRAAGVPVITPTGMR
jgi:mRNA interferase MazF